MSFPLEAYDLFMLAVLVACMLFGAWKGMAWQVAALAALVVSAIVAARCSGPLAPYISVEEPWNRCLAMLVLYVVTSLIIWMLFRIVAKAIDRVKLKEFDKQLGALFGLAKGVLWCLVITFFAVTLSESARQRVLRSRSGYFAAKLIHRAAPALPPSVREVLGEYIDELDRRLDPLTPPEARQPAGAYSGPDPAAGQPAYHIRPADLLEIEVLKTRLPETYRIAADDVLQINVGGTLAGHPIDDYYAVDGDGSINLGEAYGTVPVTGMTAEEAAGVVGTHLRQVLGRPVVSLQVARSGGVPQIGSTYAVQSDGTVGIPPYGTVAVSGKTVTEAQQAVQQYLRQFLDSPQVRLHVATHKRPPSKPTASAEGDRRFRTVSEPRAAR